MRLGTREIVRAGSSIPETVSDQIADSVLGRGPLDVSFPNRRLEIRTADQKVCAYEICTSINETGTVIEQGEAYSLNRSAHGILLLIGCFPRVGQILELRIFESRWCRSVGLYNVQWTKPLSVDSCGRLCLVGCHLVFGPSRYWAV